MYEILLHAHSGLRWFVLVLVLASIVRAFTNMSSGKFLAFDDKLTLMSLIFSHIQLVVGIALFVISPQIKAAMQYITEQGMGEMMKNAALRFWFVEHPFGMVVGIALITIGRISSRNAKDDQAKFKKVALYFTVGLLIIFASIPWPFREAVARGLF